MEELTNNNTEQLNQQPQPETPLIESTPTPKQNNNVFKILFFITLLILLIVVVLVVFFFIKKKNQSIFIETNKQGEETIIPTIETTSVSSLKDTVVETKSLDGSIECYQNSKYFIALKNGQSENSRILVRPKTNTKSNINCLYNFENSDFEITEWITQILNLNNNFLITDSGTSAGQRTFYVYDLDKRVKIYNDLYYHSLELLDNNIITYWKGTTIKTTKENCPALSEENDLADFYSIEERVQLNLSTLEKNNLDEYRCVYHE